MRQISTIVAVWMLTGSVVWAAPLDHAAIDAVPQRYLMTLPQTPIAEVAEEVLGQTLGLPVSVDPRVDGQMTFRVDGVYAPRALARELGYQLWNVDVALIEDRSHSLILIPASALPEAIAQGSEVVSPLALQTPSPVTTASATGASKPIVYGNRRGLENSGLILLALAVGWIGGLLSPRLIRMLRFLQARRQRIAARIPNLRLEAPIRTVPANDDETRLVTPVFTSRID